MPTRFTVQEVERLRYWVRRGKVIAVGAELMEKSPNFALISKQMAFAAGASFCFDLIQSVISDDKEATEFDFQLIAKLHDELVEWDQRLRQIIVSPLVNQGKLS